MTPVNQPFPIIICVLLAPLAALHAAGLAAPAAGQKHPAVSRIGVNYSNASSRVLAGSQAHACVR